MMSRLGIVGSSGEMETSSRFVVDEDGCDRADRDAWRSATASAKKTRGDWTDAASTSSHHRRQSPVQFPNGRHLHHVRGYARGRRLARQIKIAREHVAALEATQRRALPGLLKLELDAARRRLSDLLRLQVHGRKNKRWAPVPHGERLEGDDGARNVRNTWCEAHQGARMDVRVSSEQAQAVRA